MKYRQFGKMGSVSEVGMGCRAIGGNAYGNSYGTTDDGESLKAIKQAVELGCNFFDTADVYGHGHSEELLGMALHGVRNRVFIATKAGGAYMYNNDDWGHVNFTHEYLQFALEQSLNRLRTNYIDVYQLHNPPLRLINEGEIFKPLRKLQASGKIKQVGVSVFTLEEGIAALEHVDSVHCVFNIIDPRNYEMMETAKRRGIAVVVREAMANGLLAGKHNSKSVFEKGDIRAGMPADYKEGVAEFAGEIRQRFRRATLAQVALKYVLNFDCVTTVIAGTKTAEQAAENMGASELAALSEEELNFFGS